MKPLVIAALLVCCPVLHAGDNQPATPQPNEKAMRALDIRKVLESGKVANGLPEGMVIRLGACLGESDMKASGTGVPDELKETWEFASHQVHRVVFEYKKDKSTYRRDGLRPFDSKDICKDLLEGKAIQIQARKGEGPELAFVGTPYHRGSRSIEVVWKGETILNLHETNGPFLGLYRESDARAFGALYEGLAKQARAAFEVKAR